MRALVLAIVTSVPAAALQDWPGWRGPRHDGSSDATGIPTVFGREQHVRWAAALPGPGAGTPIVLGDRVFVSSTVPEAGVLLALCLDRASGEVRWEDEAGSGRARGDSQVGHDDRSDYASPSPVTDGERVVFFFGNGDLVAYDLDGKRLWARNVQADHGDFAFQWTFGASPTLWEGRLFLPVLQRNEPVGGFGKPGAASFLLAIDPADGETLWVHERPSQARLESRESYATAIPCTSAGRKELLVVGGDVLSAHAPETGEELWRWGSWNEGHREEWWRIVPSPVVGGGVVLVAAPKRAPVYAVKLGGRGQLGDDWVLWKSAGRRDPVSSDVPTPLYLDERFFVLSERGALSRVVPATGQVEWTAELPDRSPWEASPTGAEGRIYCVNHAGLVVAVDAATGKLVQSAELGGEDGDRVRSSIAIAHGALFVRTDTTLFCIGS